MLKIDRRLREKRNIRADLTAKTITFATVIRSKVRTYIESRDSVDLADLRELLRVSGKYNPFLGRVMRELGWRVSRPAGAPGRPSLYLRPTPSPAPFSSIHDVRAHYRA